MANIWSRSQFRPLRTWTKPLPMCSLRFSPNFDKTTEQNLESSPAFTTFMKKLDKTGPQHHYVFLS